MEKVKLQQSDAIDRNIIGKYSSLVDTINSSEQDFYSGDYNDCHEKLLGKANKLAPRGRSKNKARHHAQLHSGEEWK
jgi:hypothetical protein